MMFSAAILANKLVNFIPKALIKNNLDDISSYSFLFFRTKKIDQLVKYNIEKVEQFVVLGAGFDLRSIRYDNDKLKVFELDKKNTQNFKLDTLKKANILTKNISYIECDLNNSDWSNDLIKQGFKKNKKTLFLFESVGCYLEEDIVNNILSTIKSISAKGSIVIQDLYSTRFLHQDEFQRVKRGKKLIQNFGENWNFTVNMDNNVESQISILLEKNNLIPLENYICGKNSTKSKNPFYAISLSKV
jgi:methyltransferase (TIGR00027 family)